MRVSTTSLQAEGIISDGQNIEYIIPPASQPHLKGSGPPGTYIGSHKNISHCKMAKMGGRKNMDVYIFN